MELNLKGQKLAVFGAANGIAREDCRVIGFDSDPDAAPITPESTIHLGDVTDYDDS